MARNLCIVCNRRRGKRWCPALNGYICSYCCGSKRGEGIRCSSNCPYWVQGEGYKAAKKEGSKQPFQEENKEILVDILGTILEVKERFPELSDNDVKEGLTLLIKTYETRQKGLIYEYKSTIPLVTAISYRLGKTLERRMERGEGHGDRVSLQAVILTLKETLSTVTSYGEDVARPMAFLDYLSELEKEDKRRRMELP